MLSVRKKIAINFWLTNLYNSSVLLELEQWKKKQRFNIHHFWNAVHFAWNASYGHGKTNMDVYCYWCSFGFVWCTKNSPR